MEIIILSITIQFFTAAYAVRLIKKTGVLISWIFVSSALILMGIRRIITLYLYSHPSSGLINPYFELIGLLLTILMCIGIIGLGRIITERKEIQQKEQNLLKEKEILLKEVHHRIKNNMNTVSTLLKLQAETAEDSKTRESIRKAENRVRSMFHLYNRLYQAENFDNVSAKKYFTPLLEEIINNTNSGKINLQKKISIEDFEIDIQKTYYIGIIINELITNSIKYAFENSPNPKLSVIIKKIKEDALIVIRDNGKGFNKKIIEIEEGNFGMKLVKSLSEQLHADIFYNTDNGTEFTLSVPLKQ